MARDDERLERAQEEPIVGSLPELPGILTALRLTPELRVLPIGFDPALLFETMQGGVERALLHAQHIVRQQQYLLGNAPAV